MKVSELIKKLSSVDPALPVLVEGYEWGAHDLDQVEITQIPLMTGIISNIRTEAKCRLYRRMMPKIGEFFYFGPKGNSPALVAVSS